MGGVILINYNASTTSFIKQNKNIQLDIDQIKRLTTLLGNTEEGRKFLEELDDQNKFQEREQRTRDELVFQNYECNHCLNEIDKLKARLNSINDQKRKIAESNEDILWESIRKQTTLPSQQQQKTVRKLLKILQLPQNTPTYILTAESFQRGLPDFLLSRYKDILAKAIHSRNDMYELLLEFFKANQTQFYGGQTAKGLARDLTKLCRTSETAHKLVCCWMAKLCAEPSLFDMAVSGEVPYEIVRPFAFSKSEIPETLGNMIKLPLQGGYRVNKVNLCTGEITHNEADRCAVIDHEFDHFIDFLSYFFGGYLKDHKDLTLERIVPQIHEVVPDPLVFSKKMKENPVFFNSVCEFFDEYWQLDESTNEFQKRTLQKALDHFNDWSLRSQSTWLSEDEVWVMVGLKLAQRLNEQPMLFINSMSDTAQAFELGLELPFIHEPFNSESFADWVKVTPNNKLYWALAHLFGIHKRQYLYNFHRNFAQPSPLYTFSGPLQSYSVGARRDVDTINALLRKPETSLGQRLALTKSDLPLGVTPSEKNRYTKTIELLRLRNLVS